MRARPLVPACGIAFLVAALGAASLSASSLSGCAASPRATEPARVTAPASPPRLAYPSTRKGDVVDDYHGVKVPDPYRWLEEPSTPEARAWIEAQNKVTFGFLDKIPGRQRWAERLTELVDYERYDAPVRHGRWYFYSHNDGLQNQSVLYKMAGLDGKPEVLLDPNTLSKDGTIAIGGLGITEDGSKLAYALSVAGSDWTEWHVRDVASGKDLPDVVKWSKFSGASFLADGSGFFYSRYPEPKAGAALEEANFFHQLWFHKLGTEQAADVLVFDDKVNKKRSFSGSVTDDGKYLVIGVWEGTDRRTRIYYQEMGAKKGKAPVVRLIDTFDAAYHFVGNRGSTFFVHTDLDAPRGRLVAIDLKKPDRKAWRELIPQSEDKLEAVHHVGDGFVAYTLHRAAARVAFHKESGERVREIALPGIGDVDGFNGRFDDQETFYSFASFTQPATVFRLDLKTGQSTLFRQPKLKFDPAQFETQQVSYKSKDGTEVPMFLVAKKGLAKTGAVPTYLYGYGGFNISLTPDFSTRIIALVERGFLYAQPSLRGGGEFGESWHEGGMLAAKQNTFDDFAAAAQYLVQSGWTRPSRIAISGRSNGGLLVGASITQHPELFGAALAGVGVMDMLRFHKFTIGHAWTSDYGSADDPKGFEVLRAYSPLHNIKPGVKYPPTFIVTGDHDDRVVPAHSFKFAAALQAAQAGPSPVLIRIDVASGHGAGKPLKKQIEEYSDSFAFLEHVLSQQ
jgi:prolyl oligopeptidase